MWVYIRNDDAGVTIVVYSGSVVEKAEGDVACSAGYVEHCLGGLWGAGIQGADEVVFPEAVDAEGH